MKSSDHSIPPTQKPFDLDLDELLHPAQLRAPPLCPELPAIPQDRSGWHNAELRTASCFVGNLRSSAAAEPEKPAGRPLLALPERPSIAVLPFQNLSGDPDQGYFADGMVDDIITGLSRIRWLFVIARNSSFLYRDKALGVTQISQELGARYVLDGTVRKAGRSYPGQYTAHRNRECRPHLGRTV